MGWPKFAIINYTDAPQPDMVCQFMPGIGYCYLDRKKASYDGMISADVTSVDEFGFVWTINRDGTVSFYRSSPSFATYHDGKPRQWQGTDDSFEFRRLVLKKGKVQQAKEKVS